MEWQEKGPDRLGYTERDFKVCILCDALNPVTNAECFVCGWNGTFHMDSETIKDGMRALERRYGGLDESLFIEETVPSTPPRRSRWTEFWRSLRGILGRA